MYEDIYEYYNKLVLNFYIVNSNNTQIDMITYYRLKNLNRQISLHVDLVQAQPILLFEKELRPRTPRLLSHCQSIHQTMLNSHHELSSRQGKRLQKENQHHAAH